MAHPPLVGAMPLHVERHTGDGGAWDDFLSGHPDSTFCHLAGWREVITDTLGHECTYLVARDEEGLWHGVLPLAHVRSRLFGDYLVSMPFLNSGGAIGADHAQHRLACDARAMAAQRHVKLLELRARQPGRTPLQTAARKVTVLLPLPAVAQQLWDGFPSKLRSQIRRPIREEMEVRFGPEQRHAFYDVFSRNMHALGTPVLPRAFFERIARVFPEVALFGVVYWRDEPVAAGCGFLWQGEFEITWASSLREHNTRAPNMLLYWSFMDHVIGRSARVFSFGRCTPDGGTHRFKLQWGGRTEPLPWQYWSTSGTNTTPNPQRPLFKLATRMWTRLPRPVANRAGPLLARNLP